MTPETSTQIDSITHPTKTGIFIKCACGAEGVDISVDSSDEEWSQEKTFYLSFWRYGRGPVHSFKTRLSRAWNVLIGKGYEADEVILNEKEAYQLREFISRHLYDRDLLETLRQENQRLNEALMKTQLSSDYDRGLDHGQESSLAAIKKYFDEMFSGDRSGVSRLTTLLDGCLHKLEKLKQL